MHTIKQLHSHSVGDETLWSISSLCECGWRTEILQASKAEADAAEAAARDRHLRDVHRLDTSGSPGTTAAAQTGDGAKGGGNAWLGALLVVALLAGAGTCAGTLDAGPSCDDVSFYSDRAYDAGQQNFDEDSMNDYVEAQRDLETAEADCADEGQTPEY